MSVEARWRELVTAALLGTDRRDPPEVGGALGDLAADAVRDEPAERMLALVAAATAVRRAGVLPGSATAPLAEPAADPRPPCTPAAVDRWHHVTTSWPVLEDEWTLVLIERGWRAAPELAPAMLRRHRRDAVRRARAEVAIGPLATWLSEHLPELEATSGARRAALDPEALGALPELPIPPELAVLADRSGAELGGAVAVGLEDRSLGEAHRAVLVNLLARCPPGSLADVGEVLDAVDPVSPGRGLASVLADLALTRRRMLDELAADPDGGGAGHVGAGAR